MLHYVGLLPSGKLAQPVPSSPQAQEWANVLCTLDTLDGREGTHRLLLGDGRVSVTLCMGEAQTTLTQQSCRPMSFT